MRSWDSPRDRRRRPSDSQSRARLPRAGGVHAVVLASGVCLGWKYGERAREFGLQLSDGFTVHRHGFRQPLAEVRILEPALVIDQRRSLVDAVEPGHEANDALMSRPRVGAGTVHEYAPEA